MKVSEISTGNFQVFCECCGSVVGRVHERPENNRNRRYEAIAGYSRLWFRKFEDALLWVKNTVEQKAGAK